MTDRLLDFIIETLTIMFIPLVCSYYTLSASVFFNVSTEDACGMEWLGNKLLSPAHYIFAGSTAIQKPDGSWEFAQRYDYEDQFWARTAACLISLPPSLILGSVVKALSLAEEKGRNRYRSIVAAKESKEVYSNRALYNQIGLKADSPVGSFTSLGCQRRPGDENVLAIEKEALRDIGNAFNKAGIPWWVDCGTCLGTYRYGGAIPWDGDIDIAVLAPDFDNVCRALNQLSRDQYLVQDWSSRSHPKSFIKVYIRKTGTLIDIYHFAIDEKKREIRYILSLETQIFWPEWWKIRERRFKVPVAFDTVFPLKRAEFDGVAVFVPNDTKKYLQRYYGENLDPVKIYNPETGSYEKDLNHPYWLEAYVH